MQSLEALCQTYGWDLASPADQAAVARQLGREPRGMLAVARRCRHGCPQVIVNDPLLRELRDSEAQPSTNSLTVVQPVGMMPTLFWLTCPYLQKAVGTLEASGGVHRMQQAIRADASWREALSRSHDQNAWLRIQLIGQELLTQLEATHPDRGAVLRRTGVAGLSNRDGVKCLHAHLADYLGRRGGDDTENPVGKRVAELLAEAGISHAGPVHAETCCEGCGPQAVERATPHRI